MTGTKKIIVNLGKHDEELGPNGSAAGEEDEDDAKPFDLSALKTRAFVVTQRERREAALAAARSAGDDGAGVAGGPGGADDGKEAGKKGKKGRKKK